MVTTDDKSASGSSDDADPQKKPPKTARFRSPKPVWPDDVDDVELERAFHQVPPFWLLGVFKQRGYHDHERGVADVSWTFLGKTEPDHFGEAVHGRKVMCSRCSVLEPSMVSFIWVKLYSWFQPARVAGESSKTLFRIGQCRACGSGYWTEVRTA
jgi:hypothetical protein